jgi:hypothetical protein
MRTVAVLLILSTLSSPAFAHEAREATGEALYRSHCAECHNGSLMRAPSTLRIFRLSRTSLALGSIPILNHDSPKKKSGY